MISAATGADHKGFIEEVQCQFNTYFAGDKLGIHPALRCIVFGTAISEGSKTEFDYVWSEYLNSTSVDGKEITLQAMGRVKQQDLVESYLERMITDDIPLQNTHYVSSSLAANSDARPFVWKFVEKNWDTIYKMMSENMVTLNRFVRTALSKYSD